MRPILSIAALSVPLFVLAACGGGGDSAADATATGPITVWLSNNQEEVAWGTAMVEAWNAEHPDQLVTAQEIPAGKSSEEVIGAAITAGNAPCLIFNVSPAAVPQFQKQGGLVALDELAGGADYITARSGDVAEQYRSEDDRYYQLPWKSNPVMIFYNKDLFTEAGLDAENPPLATYDEFLDTSRTLVSSGAVEAAIYPAPTSEFFQSWFDFYPLYAAATGGRQLVEDQKSTFASAEGQAVVEFWRTMYEEKLAPQEEYNGDSFADAKAAMAIVGPWAIPVYADTNWGAVPVPTPDGMPIEEIHTFSDAKNVAMFSACQNRGTAWEVLKFATSEAQDGELLTATGQMPLRTDLQTTYAEYFEANPDYSTFADLAGRTTEVPNVANSIEIWQTFRDSYSKSVIFGEDDPGTSLEDAATAIDTLASQS